MVAGITPESRPGSNRNTDRLHLGFRKQGWTDALRTIHPDETIYTFWDYLRNAYNRNAGLRIDHLLLSPALAGRLVDAQVDHHVRGWEKSSDHAPTWIELAPEKATRKRRA